jgi:hypothetical protein
MELHHSRLGGVRPQRPAHLAVWLPAACPQRTSSPILQNLVFGTHTPLTAASTLSKSKVRADIRSSGALCTHNET